MTLCKEKYNNLKRPRVNSIDQLCPRTIFTDLAHSKQQDMCNDCAAK